MTHIHSCEWSTSWLFSLLIPLMSVQKKALVSAQLEYPSRGTNFVIIYGNMMEDLGNVFFKKEADPCELVRDSLLLRRSKMTAVCYLLSKKTTTTTFVFALESGGQSWGRRRANTAFSVENCQQLVSLPFQGLPNNDGTDPVIISLLSPPPFPTLVGPEKHIGVFPFLPQAK